MPGTIESIYTPAYLTRAVNNLQKRKKLLEGIIPTVPSEDAILGNGGGDKANWYAESMAVKRAKISIRGMPGYEVPLQSGDLRSLLHLTTKEKTKITSAMRQVWQDPVKRKSLSKNAPAQVLTNLSNRYIVGENDAMAEALRLGTITRSDSGVAVDFGITSGTLPTPWGTGNNDLVATAALDIVNNIVRPIRLNAHIGCGLLISNSLTAQYFTMNVANGDSGLQLMYYQMLQSQGTFPAIGGNVKWIIVDDSYTNSAGAEVEYFPTGYICGVGGVGAEAVPGVYPVYYEQGTPEFNPSSGLPDTTVGMASWIEELPEGMGQMVFVSTCETPIIALPEAVRGLYVL